MKQYETLLKLVDFRMKLEVGYMSFTIFNMSMFAHRIEKYHTTVMYGDKSHIVLYCATGVSLHS